MHYMLKILIRDIISIYMILLKYNSERSFKKFKLSTNKSLTVTPVKERSNTMSFLVDAKSRLRMSLVS